MIPGQSVQIVHEMPISKMNTVKWCGPSGRVPVLQVQRHEFKSQSPLKRIGISSSLMFDRTQH
jgi:hypothetical protein